MKHTEPFWAHREEDVMSNKAVISLTTGLEDPEKVTVALLVAVGSLAIALLRPAEPRPTVLHRSGH